MNESQFPINTRIRLMFPDGTELELPEPGTIIESFTIQMAEVKTTRKYRPSSLEVGGEIALY